MSSLATHSPLKIAIAGLGPMGRYHLERLSLRKDCRLVAAFDVDQSRADYAAAYGCRLFQTWNDFRNDREIDLVLIATPPDTHAQLAIEALEAGKHVIVEKPLCLTLLEADTVLEAARCSGRMLSVVQNRRWDDDFQVALTTLQSGALGRLQAVKLIIWGYGFAEEARWQDQSVWRTQQRRGGGVLFEFGAHYFDQLLQLVPERVDSVFAQTTVVSSHTADSCERVAAEDAFLAIVKFTTGVTAQIEFNVRSLVSLHTGWTLTGSQGGYQNFRRYSMTEEGEIFHTLAESIPTDWDQYYSGIINHLRGVAAAPPVIADEARRVVALIEAARRSAKSGQVESP